MNMIRIACAALALGCVEPTAIVPVPDSTPAPVSANIQSGFTIDRSGRSVYLRFVGPPGDGQEPVHVLVRRMFESADAISADRLIVDLRSAKGSDARLLVPLLRGILMRERFQRSGALYVVIRPNSFSPRRNAAAILGRYANPIIVDRMEGSF